MEIRPLGLRSKSAVGVVLRQTDLSKANQNFRSEMRHNDTYLKWMTSLRQSLETLTIS